MKFEKYQANGNDFIIVDEKYKNMDLLAKKLCLRKYGIGGDGLIYYNKYLNQVRFYNADGSEAKLCGNGLRCLGLYLYKHGLMKVQKKINVYYQHYYLKIIKDNPFLVKVILPQKNYNIEVNYLNKKKLFLINLANKHIVMDYSLEEKLEFLKNNYSGYNFNFVKVISKNKIEVKTYENGVGFTLSCGSGSFASSYVYNNLQLINKKVNVNDNLVIDLTENSLMGNAEFVYRGEI